MGTKYTTQTVSGYNSTPPSDDGAQTAANKITWAFIKTKLSDAVLALAQAINTALVTALDTSNTSQTANYTTLATDNQKPIEVTGTTTISLMGAVAAGSGYQVPITNAGVGIVTVALAVNTDTLNGVVNGTITLAPFDSAVFATSALTNGYVITSAAVNAVESYTWSSTPAGATKHHFNGWINAMNGVTAGGIVGGIDKFTATGSYSTPVTPPYGYRDEMTVTFTGNPVGRGAAAFTDARTYNGGVADHIHSFQAATLNIANNAAIDNYRAYYTIPGCTGSGGASIITNVSGFHMENPTGTGLIENLYGLYIGTLNRGRTLNYSIYTGTAPVRFGGALAVLGISTLSQGSANPTVVSQNSHATTPVAHRFYLDNDTNDANGIFWLADAAASTLRARLLSNGGLANYSANNVNLSDPKAKRMSDIPVGEQRKAFRRLSIKMGRYKDSNEDRDHLMFDASDVEQIYPECVGVFDDGMRVDEKTKALVRVHDPLKGTYEHRILMRAYKTIHEHDDLIESMRAEIAALKKSSAP